MDFLIALGTTVVYFYNTVSLPVAALGFLNPIIAAAMAMSSLSVMVNSALLKRAQLSKA